MHMGWCSSNMVIQTYKHSYLRQSIHGVVTLKTADGKTVQMENTIVNLSAFLTKLITLSSTPSSLSLPQIGVNGNTYPATLTVGNGQLVYTTKLSQPANVLSLQLYPSSLSTFTGIPIAIKQLETPVNNVTEIQWTLYINDQSGLLYNGLPYQVIPSTNFYTAIFINDLNTSTLTGLLQYQHYVYNFLIDTTGKPVTLVNARFFTFTDFTTSPSTITISGNNGIQLVPASGSQHTVFYYWWNDSVVFFNFSFTSSSSPPADGFTVCIFASSPPIALNTSSVTGMVNPTLAYGQGQQVCVEFDPYASSPISITVWDSNGYVSTLVSASGAGSGTSMTAGHFYQLLIQTSSSSISVTVTDLTANTTVASASASVPFTLSPPGYVIVTARNGGNYANWSLVQIEDWYPYGAGFPVNLQSPILIPITAIFEGSGTLVTPPTIA
ncbi:putative lectin [Sulfolobales Beppu filamentous virus 3]|uniref:Putative lectin n=1 Tax=Sulfolobales Beppu filamentous virus 3 TaxID=2493124 RepID=A0A3Q8Q9Y1_9VIRU|nr:putative lectin [Sulfolobales Beppu filamentous virus 3]AZI75865.1 putative lectin [Sulfolobales Beppu filamentous virus 3]